MEGPLSTSPTKLLCEHMEAKRAALEAFNTSSSYGTNFVSTNSKSLERDIDEKFAYYRELNESKKLGKRFKATLEQLSDNEMYRFATFLTFLTDLMYIHIYIQFSISHDDIKSHMNRELMSCIIKSLE